MAEAAGKYARWELERRFLLARVPEEVDRRAASLIVDRYIDGTRLRLRRIEPQDGGEPTYKLGQKEAPDPSDFSRTTITNIYLSAEERAAAPVLHRALRAGAALVDTGERDPSVVRTTLVGLVAAEPLATLDYAEIVDAHGLAVPARLTGELRLLIAARFGRARLIDNLGVTVS